jgi:competence protein ComEA
MIEANVPPPCSPAAPAPAGPKGGVSAAGTLTSARVTWPRLWEHALAFVLGACAILVAQSAWRLWRPPEPLAAGPAVVDLNSADVGTLRQLPGVGPHLAARIVEHRSKQGPFGSVDDLRAVPGIGPATLERLRPVVSLSPDAEANLAPGSPALPKSSGGKLSSGEQVDLNTATCEQLMGLPGIGRVLAERIVQDREGQGPFRSVHELTRVRGIKAKTLEKLLPYVKVASGTGAPAT